MDLNRNGKDQDTVHSALYPELKGKSILITGATGLIGSCLVRRLLETAEEERPEEILLLVRNEAKAMEKFQDALDHVTIISGDITDPPEIFQNVDYIIHAASQTSSKAFVDIPVDVILTNILGTRNMLELAKMKKSQGFVYTSTMEVYGTPQTDEKITENHGCDLNTMKVRSSYPESKRVCEALCVAYASQFGVPAKVVRLTQTFGPGVEYDDPRVFAEFARCAVEKRDIFLQTKGETKRSYLYTEDAVEAILTVLVRGEAGEAYNAANEETYCTIREMAETVAKEFGEGRVQVRNETRESEKTRAYAPVLHMNLDTEKLRKLGWQPKVGLTESYFKMLKDIQKKRSSFI